MKKILFAFIASGITMCSFGQADTTSSSAKPDTIRVGEMIIIKKHGPNGKPDKDILITSSPKSTHTNVSTNWWIFDIGFANFNDNSNYASSQAMGFTGAGVGKDQFKLRTGKSVNVNVWIFMQKLNLVSHVVNLKYGLGLELNNYRFENNELRFSKDPTSITIDPSLSNVHKNKLAADYVTVPLMLNFNFTPSRKRGFGFSAGVSAGYLYSSRQKLKVDHNKTKLHNDFDLEKWKLSYVGELSLGSIRFYGSYAFKSMWSKGLDQTPYSIGLRLSNW